MCLITLYAYFYSSMINAGASLPRSVSISLKIRIDRIEYKLSVMIALLMGRIKYENDNTFVMMHQRVAIFAIFANMSQLHMA